MENPLVKQKQTPIFRQKKLVIKEVKQRMSEERNGNLEFKKYFQN